MKKRLQYHNPPPPDVPPLGPDAVRAAFGAKLQRYLVERGWNQSDLARAATKFMPEGEIVSRDSISKYVRGRNIPTPVTLHAIAGALGVEPEDILPEQGVPSVGADAPTLQVSGLTGGYVWLRVNQAVPMAVAVKILALLEVN